MSGNDSAAGSEGKPRLGPAGLWCLVAILFAVFVGQIVLRQTTTFHTFDVILRVAVVVGLVGGGLAGLVIAIRLAAVAAWLKRTNRPTRVALGLGVIACLWLPSVVVLGLDERLDFSPGVPQVLNVRNKWISTFHHWKTCIVGVQPDAGRPLFAFERDLEPVRLPCPTWSAIVPGHSTLTLAVHPGRYGFPWYDPNVVATP